MIEKLYLIFCESLRCVEELIVTLADFFVRDSFIANHHEVHVLKRSFCRYIDNGLPPSYS